MRLLVQIILLGILAISCNIKGKRQSQAGGPSDTPTDGTATSGTNEGASGDAVSATSGTQGDSGSEGISGALDATSGVSGITNNSDEDDTNPAKAKIDTSNNAAPFIPLFSVTSADKLSCTDYAPNTGKAIRDSLTHAAASNKSIISDNPCASEGIIARCNIHDQNLNMTFSDVYYIGNSDVSQLSALSASAQMSCVLKTSENIFATFTSYLKK